MQATIRNFKVAPNAAAAAAAAATLELLMVAFALPPLATSLAAPAAASAPPTRRRARSASPPRTPRGGIAPRAARSGAGAPAGALEEFSLGGGDPGHARRRRRIAHGRGP